MSSINYADMSVKSATVNLCLADDRVLTYNLAFPTVSLSLEVEDDNRIFYTFEGVAPRQAPISRTVRANINLDGVVPNGSMRLSPSPQPAKETPAPQPEPAPEPQPEPGDMRTVDDLPDLEDIRAFSDWH